MRGPGILARTMSVASRRGKSDRTWQYHSRSDHHSKVACWAVLLDMMIECDAFREAAAHGLLGFALNRVVVAPINKTLDLVITRGSGDVARNAPTQDFAGVGGALGVVLDDDCARVLARLPILKLDDAADAREVAVALEAKACMTEHIKSLPRLHAEILATGYLTKRGWPHAITVSYSLVNTAATFVTPSGNGRVNRHRQPEDARRVVEMIDRAVPTLNETRDFGYDVVGVTAVECRNDGSTVELADSSDIGLGQLSRLKYEHMIRALCSQFRARFGR